MRPCQLLRAAGVPQGLGKHSSLRRRVECPACAIHTLLPSGASTTTPATSSPRILGSLMGMGAKCCGAKPGVACQLTVQAAQLSH